MDEDDVNLEDLENWLYSQVYHSKPEELEPMGAPLIIVNSGIPTNTNNQTKRRYFMDTSNINHIPLSSTPRQEEKQDSVITTNSTLPIVVNPINNIIQLNLNLSPEKRTPKKKKSKGKKKKASISAKEANIAKKQLQMKQQPKHTRFNENEEVICISDTEECIVVPDTQKSEVNIVIEAEESNDDVLFIEPEPVPFINLDPDSPPPPEPEPEPIHSPSHNENQELQTPESNQSNDFIDTTAAELGQCKFNFSLHGNEFNEEDHFVRPANPNDLYETESSCSTTDFNKDLNSTLKAAVFNVVEFPKEDLFAENNLESFGNYITPKRKKAVHAEKGNESDENKMDDDRSQDEIAEQYLNNCKNLPELSPIITEEKIKEIKKKKKKKKNKHSDREDEETSAIEETPSKPKKKKKKNYSNELTGEETISSENLESETIMKCKKKKKKHAELEDSEVIEDQMETTSKSKKKRKSEMLLTDSNQVNKELDFKPKRKKKRSTSDVENVTTEELTPDLTESTADSESVSQESVESDGKIKRKKKRLTSEKSVEESGEVESGSKLAPDLSESSETVSQDTSEPDFKPKRKKKCSTSEKSVEDVNHNESVSLTPDLAENNEAENLLLERSESDYKPKKKKKRSLSEKSNDETNEYKTPEEPVISSLTPDTDTILSEPIHENLHKKGKESDIHNSQPAENNDSLDINKITPSVSETNITNKNEEVVKTGGENFEIKSRKKLKSDSENHIEESRNPINKNLSETFEEQNTNVKSIVDDLSGTSQFKKKKELIVGVLKTCEPDFLARSLPLVVTNVENIVSGTESPKENVIQHNVTLGSEVTTFMKEQQIEDVDKPPSESVEKQLLPEKDSDEQPPTTKATNEMTVQEDKIVPEETSTEKENQDLNKGGKAFVLSTSILQLGESESDVELVEDPSIREFIIVDEDSDSESSDNDIKCVETDLSLANCSSTPFFIDTEPTPQLFEENETDLINFDVDSIRSNMSDDPRRWKIVPQDRYRQRCERRGPRCRNCKEFGHETQRCKNRKEVKCYLCGELGHNEPRCPRKLCTQCGNAGSYSTPMCWKCVKFRNVQCDLCKMYGHIKSSCPDLWRRYYLTTEEGSVVKPDSPRLKPKDQLWCCGCGNSGHLEQNCLYYLNRVYPCTDINIHSYENVYKPEQLPPPPEQDAGPGTPSLSRSITPEVEEHQSAETAVQPDCRRLARHEQPGTSFGLRQQKLPRLVQNVNPAANTSYLPLNVQNNFVQPQPGDLIQPNYQSLPLNLIVQISKDYASGNQFPIFGNQFGMQQIPPLFNVGNQFNTTPLPLIQNDPLNINSFNEKPLSNKIKKNMIKAKFFRYLNQNTLKLAQVHLQSKFIEVEKLADLVKSFHEEEYINRQLHMLKTVRSGGVQYSNLNLYLYGVRQIKDAPRHHQRLRDFLNSGPNRVLSDTEKTCLWTSYIYIFNKGKIGGNSAYATALKNIKKSLVKT